MENSRDILSLIKYIDDNGFLYDGNAVDTRIIALLGSLTRNPNNERHWKLLWRILNPKIMANSLIDNPFTPYPTDRDFSGEIRLGFVGLHEPYLKNEFDVTRVNRPTIATAKSSSFCRHYLDIGATGSGKSIAFFGLQDEFLRIGKNYISIGFKRDGRHRIRQVNNLLVFMINQNANFGWNITIPPKGVNQKDWDLTWCRVFCETQNLSLGMESMLLEFVEKLRKKNDVITIEMLYREIKEAGFKAFRNVNWQASLVNRLEALCRFNKMLNTSKPFPLEKLVENYPIEFELDDAGEFKSTFATLISVHPYKYRIANNLRGNELWILIFCDEGLFIGSKEIQRSCFLGEPMLFSLIRLAREFGIGFVLGTSESTSLSDTIKSNCYMQVFMGSNRFGEVLDFGRNANANKEQLEFIPKLLEGQGIMKMGNLNLFPITFPYVEIKKDVSEAEIDEQDTRLLQGTEFESVIKPESGLIVAEEAESEELKPDERAFLWDVYNRPYLSKQERMESISL